jgi:hypothetical protein
VLVREGFSWGALLFGPFWLLSHRAWIPGVLALAAGVALAFAPPPLGGLMEWLLAWALGLFGQDLRRWSLERAGYDLVHVVAAPDADSALARLLERRPDLIGDALGVVVPA